jgi:microcystin degradation protein MlrC
VLYWPHSRDSDGVRLIHNPFVDANDIGWCFLRYKIVGVKSSTHFRAGWAPISRAILTADEPGWTSNDLFVFEPMRTKRPRGGGLWPVDDSAAYPFQAGSGGGGPNPKL